MWIKVTDSYVPNVGARGTVKQIDASSGRVLVLLGRVEECEAPGKKRTYRRKDIVPEPVFVAEELPVIEGPEEEAEEDSTE